MSAAMLNASDHLKLISLQEIEVGGQAAIERVYEYPVVDLVSGSITGTWYTYRLLVMNGTDRYYFELRTTSAEEFELYLEVARQIASTIVFLK